MKTITKYGVCLSLWVAVLLFAFSVQAQDPQFSQHYANRLYYNPAFTGAMPISLAVSYRNQWPELPVNFITYNASVDFQAPCLNSGFGLLSCRILKGKAGFQHWLQIVRYAYIVRIKRNRRESANINMGVTAKYVRKWLPDDLLFSDQLDPINGVVAGTGATVPAGSVSFRTLMLAYFRASI